MRDDAPVERYLVTGVLGCIGAWTARALVRGGFPVVGLDPGGDPRRLRLIMGPEEVASVVVESADVTDLAAVEEVVDRHAITHVIHLAALQVPACRADPVRGALVNVVGTVNVFEAVRRRRERMGPVVYTSSIGMFSRGDADPGDGRLHAAATPHPGNHYGVYKLANEGTARVYALEAGVGSIGLRPMTVYGVGRDFGLTSGPTKAMAAAVLGLPYEIGFANATVYQHAEDVASALVAASRTPATGAHVFNLPGDAADTRSLVELIEREAPEAAGMITSTAADLPFPSGIDHDGIEMLGPLAWRSLGDGVRDTVGRFRALRETGQLSAEAVGIEVG